MSAAPRPSPAISSAAITVVRPLAERIEQRRANDKRGQRALERLRSLCPPTLEPLGLTPVPTPSPDVR